MMYYHVRETESLFHKKILHVRGQGGEPRIFQGGPWDGAACHPNVNNGIKTKMFVYVCWVLFYRFQIVNLICHFTFDKTNLNLLGSVDGIMSTLSMVAPVIHRIIFPSLFLAISHSISFHLTL